ncbi:MAG TPA: adenylate/guanylate cyclase domain-containing protein [Spirochaetota bacterium]|nr:MAG: Adenylate cyclase 1 [Spirochaetes bacterium ADurb.Bin133]HNZ26194.1 adenylate/guanylate cyclase domain-containing protein [Spirochaetota bacterium]
MKEVKFKIYVGVIILALCFFVVLFTTVVYFLNSRANLMNEVVERLRSNLTIATGLVDDDAMRNLTKKINLSEISDSEISKVERSEDYLKIYSFLNTIRDANPDLILYVYILVPDNDKNYARFLVDADALRLIDEVKKTGAASDKISHFNLRYDITDQPVAVAALYERKMMIEKDFVYDKDYDSWSMMGFGPIFDKINGDFFGVVGIDISNKNIDKFLRKLFLNGVITSLVVFIVALFISLYVTNTITRPVLKITDAVKTFGNDFSYRANVESSIKEIYNLTVNFNQMADNIERFNNEREKAAKESERRLRITEVYTRRSLVDFVAKGGDPTKYKPENRQISVLFSDIRDFTELSERLSPMQVVNLLNRYFDKMNNHIMGNKGEIDKLIGDCIMAAFKDPDDSVISAIEMRRELAKFNAGEIPELSNNRPESKIINNGIGINYGTAVVGNIGSASKMDYTLIGDIVNTASRLESLTKYYGIGILISEDLKNKLTIPHHIRAVDLAIVKGKKQPVTIFEVYDYEDDRTIKIKRSIQKYLDDAFNYYI